VSTQTLAVAASGGDGCRRDQRCCKHHHRFTMETDALPQNCYCDTAHHRPHPPPWNSRPPIEPPQWDRKPLILICHRGTAHPRPESSSWNRSHVAKPSRRIEAPMGSRCRVVPMMNPCQQWNPSGGGGSGNWWRWKMVGWNPRPL
jgi:hypothetical protein